MPNPDGNIVLSTFLSRARDALDRFAEYWRRNAGEHPERYPLRMTEKEWFEEFLNWALTK